MAVEGNTWRAAKGLLGPVVSAAVLLAAVSGCSRVPDAINPVEWYKNTKDFFAGADDKKPAATESDKKQSTLVADRGKAPPGAGKPDPNLGSFPDKPPITRAERNRLTAQGLVSDSEGRRYASESIPRQGEPVGVLVPRIKAAMPDAPAAPSPPAMPTPPPAAPPPVAAPATPPLAVPIVSMAAPSASPPAPAVAPPPVTAPLSSRVRELRRARPVRRPPAAAPVLKPPPGSVPVPVPGPFETLVVSSTGVELVAVPLLASRPVAPPAPRGRVKIRREGGTLRFGQVGAALPPGAVKVATIQFSNGSAELDARDRRILDEVFRLHRQRGGKMRIIGHSSQRTRNLDPATHNMVNYRISAARADSVARELIGRGVRADEISVDARADREPIYYEFMPAGEAGNRRTEIYFER
ncbi:MAG: OmpA family protein [Alphaproteobacteria bacterium]|nr:OmpA family protein [Alphaproteobacteria bacterium]